MNILNIFLAPYKYFNALGSKPIWLLPLIILVAFAVITSSVIVKTYSYEKRIEALQERNLNPEQFEQAKKMIAGPIPLISAIAGSIIIIPLTILIVTLIINVALSFLNITNQFLITFSILVSAALIRIPAMLVKMVVTLIKGSPFIHTSLVLFFPFLNKNSFWFRFLSKFDLFTIWEIIVIAIGLKVVYDIPNKKSYYLIFGLWLFYAIITSLLMQNTIQ